MNGSQRCQNCGYENFHDATWCGRCRERLGGGGRGVETADNSSSVTIDELVRGERTNRTNSTSEVTIIAQQPPLRLTEADLEMEIPWEGTGNFGYRAHNMELAFTRAMRERHRNDPYWQNIERHIAANHIRELTDSAHVEMMGLWRDALVASERQRADAALMLQQRQFERNITDRVKIDKMKSAVDAYREMIAYVEKSWLESPELRGLPEDVRESILRDMIDELKKVIFGDLTSENDGFINLA